MLRQPVRKLFAVFLLAAALPAAGAGLEDFSLETRFGLAGLSTRLTNPAAGRQETHFLLPAYSLDIIGSWRAGFLESRLRLNITLADTNTIYTRNGIETNSPYLSRTKFLARNYFLSFREGLPFKFFTDSLLLVPSLEFRIAHYSDLSGASEFTDRTTDWFFTFLNAGLEIRYDRGWLSARASYHLPLFGILTDSLLKENRREDEFEISCRASAQNGWFSIGYNGFTLRYSTETKNGDGSLYKTKSYGILFVAAGYNF